MPDLFTPQQTSAPQNDLPQNNSDDQPIGSQIGPVQNNTSVEHHIHILSSFCQNPVGITFGSQEDGETILLFLRKHFITNVPWIFISIVLLLVPFIVHAFFNTPIIEANNLFSFLPQSFGMFFTLFYYLLITTYIFVNFITWYFNISLVTTRRVVDIDYSDVIYKTVSATTLDLVQDVNYTQIGVFPSLFDYGTVLVQTAGSIDNFDFSNVPHPERVVQIIENLIGRKRRAV